MSNVEQDVNSGLAITTEAADVASLMVPGVGGIASAVVNTADAVDGAVVANTAHKTALSTIVAGVNALAAAPAVTASPKAAAITGFAWSFLSALEHLLSEV